MISLSVWIRVQYGLWVTTLAVSPAKRKGEREGENGVGFGREGGRVEISRSICVAALKTIIALFFVFGHFSDELLLLEVIASPVSRSEVIFPRSLGVQSFLAMLINI